jgi:hypothetical protein
MNLARRVPGPSSLLPVPSTRLFDRLCRLGTAVALCVALAWSASTPGHAQEAPAPGMQVLQHHVRNVVTDRRAAFAGAMATDETMHLSIVLPLRNQAGLTSLLAQLYDPASPRYRQFLSVAEFTTQFGPTTDDYQAVVEFAHANGFTVTGDPANRLIVPIRGTVAQVDAAFHVSINTYQHPTENRTFFSPDREPSLQLSVPVSFISGLDNFSLPHHMSMRGSGSSVKGAAATVTGSGPGGSYLGSDMRAAYYGGNTLDGAGQAVGIFEFGGYLLSDVYKTFTSVGQTVNVPINNVLLDGATGGIAVTPDDAEQTLDIVQVIGMAPGLSQVRVYIGTGTDNANVLNSMASENIAKQLSCSWSWRPANPAVDDVFFQEMAAQGQSFFTASGDDGAFNASLSPFFYPQEDQYVTSVGGTHLTTTGAGGPWASEVVWNTVGRAGSGGGVSPDGIPIPSWQSGLATTANGGSSTLRNVPDVAMEGDFDNYACVLGQCYTSYAGTSFAAPRWAGFMALVNQQAVEAGNAPLGGLGFINPSLYTLAQGANAAKDLHDITSGNNDTENQPVWFNAVAGYDLTTGWGSAAGQSLIEDLAGPQVPGFWIASSQSQLALPPGGSTTTTLSVKYAGGFSDSVNFAVTSTLPDGVTATFSPNPTTGTTVLTLTATSAAVTSKTTVTVTATSGTLTASTNLTLVVHTPSFLLSASPSILGFNQGASGTSGITVTPQFGFSDAVTLTATGLPSGVTASFTPNPTTGTSTLTLTASSNATPGVSTVTVTGTSGSLTATSTISLTIHGPTFTLSGPVTASVGQGSTVTSYVSVFGQYGFTGNVSLSVSGLPVGVTAAFTPNPTSTGTSTPLVLTASSSAVVGQSILTITGTSGNLTASTTIALGVYAPSFTLSAGGSLNIGQGGTGNSYVYISPQYGFNGSVALNVTGLPAGVTALWSPNPTTGSSTLTFTASSTAKVGQYPLTITGTSGSLTATTTLTLGVYTPTFNISASSLVNIGQGTTGSSYVNVNAQYGFTGSVNLSVAGLPAGVTATFSPNPTTNSSTLTFTVGSTAALGQYNVTVTGTSGTLTSSTTVTIGVYKPTFTIGGSSGINIGQGTTATNYFYINQQYGFNGSVNFSVAGLPAGVTATFSPNPTTYSTTMTLTAASTAALGQYNLTITGTSGDQSATSTFTVGVYAPTFTLTGSGATIGQGTTATSSVYVNSQYGFTGSVNLSIAGLPPGVSGTFTPNPTTGSSTLTLTATSTAQLGQYTAVITGTSGTQTQNVNVTIGVYAPSFYINSFGVNLGQGTAATSYVYINGQYGFNGNVNLALTGLPSGVTATFSTNPTTYNSNITFTASSTATPGTTTATLTATSGTLVVTTPVTITVYAPSFSISTSYLNSLNQGSTGTVYVYVNPQYGFSAPVNLTATGLLSGVTAAFSPNPTTNTSTLTLTVAKDAAPGTGTVTVTGTSGGVSSSNQFGLTINSSSYALTAAPTTVTLAPGASEKSTVAIVPQNGFSGSVNMTATGLPAGVTATFTPNPSTGTSVMTLTASSTATPTSGTATITGTSGSLSASTSLFVRVIGAQTATSTTLALTAAGNPASSITAGTLVKATATVNAGSAPLTTGTVNFCDATATYCDPSHLIGTAQITSAGTATLSFIPGPGSRSYKAVFAGTTTNAASTSTTSNLAVTATQPTTTTIAQSGSAGNYTLAATVTGKGIFAPSGNVSFVDTNDGNFVLGTGSLTGSTPTLTLTTTQSPTIGTYIGSSTTGDFNEDGFPDIAVSSQTPNVVTILLGKGDGTFNVASSTLAISAPPTVVVKGDFNNDGHMDLAVALGNTSGLAIFLGKGDGTFTAVPTSPPTGSNPGGIAVGDFNGDGQVDLAVTNSGSSTVTVLLGNGDGTFAPSNLSPQTGQSPRAIVQGDFNADGILDLAVNNSYGANVTILLGNGDGSFSPAPAIPILGNSASIAIGDFNQDGKLDLAVGNQSTGILLYILLGNGDGTFAVGTPMSLAGSATSIMVADFNGDGKVDLAESSYETSISGAIQFGNGDGTFTAGPTFTGPYFYNEPAILAADWNGDGTPDLALFTLYTPNATIFVSQLSQKSTTLVQGIAPIGTGSHAVNASYPGDKSYAASTSANTSLTAGSGPPSVTLSLSSASITTIQPVTVTVAVSGGSSNPTPTGSLTLTSGSYTSSAATLTAGSATITVPAGSLTSGTDTLKVTYTPDSASSSLYKSSNGIGTVTVAKTAPTVTLTPSATSITITQPVTVSVVVSSGTGNPIPSGSVTLTGGSFAVSPTALVNGTGTVTIPAGALATGINLLTANYTPDTAGSALFTTASGSGSVTVTKSTPTVTLSLSSATVTVAQPLTVTVAVSGGTGAPTSTGSVMLIGGGYTSAATALSNGSASIVIPAGSLAVGADALTVSYTPDAGSSGTYNSATQSTTVTVTPAIGPTASATTVAATPSTITNMQTDAITVTVSGAGGQPTGTVTLSSGSYSAQKTLTGGAASFTIPAGALVAGANTLTAAYSGDTTYATSTGTVTVTVNPVIENVPTIANVTRGSSGTGTVTFNAGSNYAGTMSLTCTLSASPAGATSLPGCSLNPASITLANGGSATTTFTVTTTAATAALDIPSGIKRWLGGYGGGATLAMLLFFGIPSRRRRKAVMLMVLLIASIAAVSGCSGGGGGNATGNPPTNPGTSAGSYTFTVTATDSTAKVTTSANVVVTVQ